MSQSPDQQSTPDPAKDAPAEQWADWCSGRLASYEAQTASNPLTNSVSRLSFDLSALLQSGGIDRAGLAAISKHVSDLAFVVRARKFGAHHQARDGALAGYVREALATWAEADFASFCEAVGATRAGVVFTAHPTFAISRALRDVFARLAMESDTARQANLEGLAHAPDNRLGLFDEHDDVLGALANARHALSALNREIFLFAKEKFPDQWTKVEPAPVSLATWVGYDLDGRTDIHWAQTIRIRLIEKAAQLASYSEVLERICAVNDACNAGALAQKLSDAAALANSQAAAFDGDLDDPAVVVEAANMLTAGDDANLTSLAGIRKELAALIAHTTDGEAKLSLCVLRAEMAACGLGVARIHLRVNAAQVRSALRSDLGLDPDKDFIGRSALGAAAGKAASADRRDVNFASVFLERMTARRQLMLCAQILKHIDADTPIRFLIAECEAPATVMGAIYLARLYGIEERLDVSPLFETPEALESGGRFLERLIEEPEFAAYMKERGRISIQLGFSDSGRFMGQAAAGLAIERLQILLARALGKAGVKNVEALIFSTHGESFGRGAFPGSLEDRMAHVMTPWALARFAHEGVSVNLETSFQGGEGFLHFHKPALAISTVGEMFRYSFASREADLSDAFYRDINFSWDFYRGLKDWQESLFENTDYHVTIGSFAQNFLFRTGSRKTKRQSGSTTIGPRALRAIPHNAILQQLCIPANTAGGVGEASEREVERLVANVKGSARLQGVIKMTQIARDLTSLPVFRGYAGLYDATYWARLAAMADNRERRNQLQLIADRLAHQDVFTSLSRLANHFSSDLSKFDAVLHEVDGSEVTTARHEARRPLHILHSLRQSLMNEAFVLTASLPSFSTRHDVTHGDLLDLVFTLEFDELIERLVEIFPLARPEEAILRDMNEAVDGTVRAGGYPEIHDGVITPLSEISRHMREIGVGISHFYGAYG